MPLKDMPKSHRLPAPQVFSNDSLAPRNAVPKSKRRRSKHGQDGEQTVSKGNSRRASTGAALPQPVIATEAAALTEKEAIEVEKEEIQVEVDSERSNAGGDVAEDDAFVNVEVGYGTDSATLMELSLWDTELTARRTETARNMEAIQNALQMLCGGRHLRSDVEPIRSASRGGFSTLESEEDNNWSPLIPKRSDGISTSAIDEEDL